MLRVGSMRWKLYKARNGSRGLWASSIVMREATYQVRRDMVKDGIKVVRG